MNKKEQAEKTLKIIKDYKSHSNKDLQFAMDFIQEDFNFTKEQIIKLTEHLDKLELTYNTVLKEYKNRTKK
jgi:ribosomal protein S15P/S13E